MRGDKIQLPMSTCKDSSREHICNHFNRNVASGKSSFEWRSEIYSLPYFSFTLHFYIKKILLDDVLLFARKYRSTSVHSPVLRNIKIPPPIFSLYDFIPYAYSYTLWSFISLLMTVHIHRNAGRSSGFSNQHSAITANLKELRTLLKAQKQDLFPFITFFFINLPFITENTTPTSQTSVLNQVLIASVCIRQLLKLVTIENDAGYL